ncbi:MAG: electron transport complex subunit RsxE, partial [Aeromonas veronii]
LGGMREIIGMGTLFDGAELLLGEWAKSLRIELFHADASLLLAILPPGGFIGLGLLIAAKNAINDWRDRKQAAIVAHCNVAPARVRATEL